MKSVYKHFGAGGQVVAASARGEHPTTAGDIENFVDFLDSAFGRKPPEVFETMLNGYTYERWKAIGGDGVKPPGAQAGRRKRFGGRLATSPPECHTLHVTTSPAAG